MKELEILEENRRHCLGNIRCVGHALYFKSKFFTHNSLIGSLENCSRQDSCLQRSSRNAFYSFVALREAEKAP